MGCEGCKSLAFVYSNCDYTNITKSDRCVSFQDSKTEYTVIPELCPCRMCIVKSMCDVCCKEFGNFQAPHMRLSYDG